MDVAGSRRGKIFIVVGVVVVIYWVGMFVGTHVPGRPIPQDDTYSLDKLEHLGAFAGLSVLLCILGSAFGASSWKLFAGVVGLIATYALLDELSQSLVSRRSPEIFDWLADVAGACVGIGLFCAGRLIIRRHQVAA